VSKKKPVDPMRGGKRPMPRGWPGMGGGYSTYLQAPDEWRGTTVQVCGMWPFAAGTGSPMVGVPIGRNILSGATMCCDPISWFMRAKLISNPSVFVLGKPGLGKSTIIRRMALGLAGYGVMPLVLGDLKPDYKDLIEALGGQVIELGRGRGHLNVLDPGESRKADRQRAAGDPGRRARPSLDDGVGADLDHALRAADRPRRDHHRRGAQGPRRTPPRHARTTGSAAGGPGSPGPGP
jgi:hypothetical protein